MTDDPTPFRLGWEEWCALPDLGLPALKAKVDTGARTSALHAFDIEPFGPAAKPKVRFAVHPIPGRHDLTIACSAPIHDRREVTSSNGETEYRYVIQSDLQIGNRRWPVELTLTDRGAMAYRMLLGRQAIGDDMVVAPNDSFCQPTLSYDVYGSTRLRATNPQRTLRIAVLSREPRSYTVRRLIEEGEAHGHVIELIDTARCYMLMNALAPEVYYDGRRLPRFDAVIPRIGASVTPYGTAVIRQFETLGTYCLNSAQAITSSRDKLQAHQILARHHIGMPPTAFAASPKDTDNLIALVGTAPLMVKLLDSAKGSGTVRADTREAAQSVISAFRGLQANFLVQDYVSEPTGDGLRCLVLAGRVVAAVRRTAAPPPGTDPHPTAARPAKLTKTERDTATRAAKAFKLTMASVDLLRGPQGPLVIGVNATPGFEPFEQTSGKNLAALLFEQIEKRVRPAPTRKPIRRKTGA